MCVNGLPVVEIHKPPLGLNHLGPASSASPLPPTPSQLPPFVSGHSFGLAVLAAPAHDQMHLCKAYLQSGVNTKMLQ